MWTPNTDVTQIHADTAILMIHMIPIPTTIIQPEIGIILTHPTETLPGDPIPIKIQNDEIQTHPTISLLIRLNLK